MNKKYAVLLWWDAASGMYIARSPDIPGCFGQGDTRDAARENIAEAIAGCIEFMKEVGQPVPESHDYKLAAVAMDV